MQPAKMWWQPAQSKETQLVNSVFQETTYYGINGVTASSAALEKDVITMKVDLIRNI